MKLNSMIRQIPFALLISGVVMVGAWHSGNAQTTGTSTDTIPKKPSVPERPKDIDDVLKEIEKGQEQLEKTFQETDWKKMEVEIQESLKKSQLDMKKMQEDLSKSLKEIDAEKMKKEIEASIAKIDFEKIKKEMDQLREIDMDKMKKEMEKMQVELKNIQPKIKKSLEEAKVGLEKAKKEMEAFKGFINDLGRDGLINKNENYTVEYKDGELIINGTKQPESVTKKYSGFLKDRKNFKLIKDVDHFDIKR